MLYHSHFSENPNTDILSTVQIQIKIMALCYIPMADRLKQMPQMSFHASISIIFNPAYFGGILYSVSVIYCRLVFYRGFSLSLSLSEPLPLFLSLSFSLTLSHG